MQCPSCHAMWKTNDRIKYPDKCPFCGMRLAGIDYSLFSELRNVITNRGIEIIKNRKVLSALIMDLLPLSKTEQISLKVAVNEGICDYVYNAIVDNDVVRNSQLQEANKYLINIVGMNNTRAQFVIAALCFIAGITPDIVEQNYCDGDNAYYEMACKYWDGGLIDVAIDLFLISIRAGNISAAKKFVVNLKYIKPQKVSVQEWFKINKIVADDYADTGSSYVVANGYAYGIGSKADLKKSIIYYSKSVENSVFNGNAFAELGLRYCFGIGVPRRKKLGIEYMEKACNYNDTIMDAINCYFKDDSISYVMFEVSEYYKKDSQQKSLFWLKKSADLGNEDAIDLYIDMLIEENAEMSVLEGYVDKLFGYSRNEKYKDIAEKHSESIEWWKWAADLTGDVEIVSNCARVMYKQKVDKDIIYNFVEDNKTLIDLWDYIEVYYEFAYDENNSIEDRLFWHSKYMEYNDDEGHLADYGIMLLKYRPDQYSKLFDYYLSRCPYCDIGDLYYDMASKITDDESIAHMAFRYYKLAALEGDKNAFDIVVNKLNNRGDDKSKLELVKFYSVFEDNDNIYDIVEHFIEAGKYKLASKVCELWNDNRAIYLLTKLFYSGAIEYDVDTLLHMYDEYWYSNIVDTISRMSNYALLYYISLRETENVNNLINLEMISERYGLKLANYLLFVYFSDNKEFYRDDVEAKKYYKLITDDSSCVFINELDDKTTKEIRKDYKNKFKILLKAWDEGKYLDALFIMTELISFIDIFERNAIKNIYYYLYNRLQKNEKLKSDNLFVQTVIKLLNVLRIRDVDKKEINDNKREDVLLLPVITVFENERVLDFFDKYDIDIIKELCYFSKMDLRNNRYLGKTEYEYIITKLSELNVKLRPDNISAFMYIYPEKIKVIVNNKPQGWEYHLYNELFIVYYEWLKEYRQQKIMLQKVDDTVDDLTDYVDLRNFINNRLDILESIAEDLSKAVNKFNGGDEITIIESVEEFMIAYKKVIKWKKYLSNVKTNYRCHKAIEVLLLCGDDVCESVDQFYQKHLLFRKALDDYYSERITIDELNQCNLTCNIGLKHAEILGKIMNNLYKEYT